MHTIVKQPCSSSTMNHATSCEIIVRKRKTAELYSKRCNYEKLVKIQCIFSCDTCFFPAMHVSKGFGPDTAPIRSRYGPDTVPIRPRYGPDMAPIWPRYGPDTAPIRPRYGPDTSPIRPPKCIFPKFNRQRLAFFEKIGTIKN